MSNGLFKGRILIGRHSRAEGYLSEDISVFWHDVFDNENDGKIPIGYVYYDWYHIHDK